MSVEYVTNENEWYKGYEIYEVLNGSGQISLKGNSNELGLCFENKPIAFCWADCQGSIGQYLVRGMKYELYEESIQKIRTFLNDDIEDIKKALSVHLYDFLQLFTEGQYLLKSYSLEEYETLSYKTSALTKEEDFFTYEPILIETQPKIYLNETRVDEYIVKIKKGITPKIVVASLYGDNRFYILDGHHKLEAYKKLNKKPYIIEIVSVSSKSLRLEEGLSFINAKETKNLYKSVKIDYFDRYKNEIFRFPTGENKIFFQAIEDKNIEKIELMLSKDSKFLEQSTVNGLLPLHFTSSLGYIEILEVLLKFTKDINIKDRSGEGVLFYTINDKQIETVKFLVKNGADIDMLGVSELNKDETPLGSAIAWGGFDIAKLLLELGADPKLAKRDLIESASHRKNAVEIIEILIDYGIKPTKEHQKTILNPSVRAFLDEYFLEIEGVGGNIIYDKIEKNIEKLDKCIVKTNSKFPFTIREITQWSNQDIFQAEVKIANDDGYTISFMARDYRKNKKLYAQGGKQEIYFSGIAKYIKEPMEVTKEYINCFGKLKEKDYHLWSYHQEDEYETDLLGKVLSLKEFVCNEKVFKHLEVKTKITERKKDGFFILPLIVEMKNIEIRNLKVGDIVDGSVYLQGCLEDKI